MIDDLPLSLADHLDPSRRSRTRLLSPLLRTIKCSELLRSSIKAMSLSVKYDRDKMDDQLHAQNMAKEILDLLAPSLKYLHLSPLCRFDLGQTNMDLIMDYPVTSLDLTFKRVESASLGRVIEGLTMDEMYDIFCKPELLRVSVQDDVPHYGPMAEPLEEPIGSHAHTSQVTSFSLDRGQHLHATRLAEIISWPVSLETLRLTDLDCHLYKYPDFSFMEFMRSLHDYQPLLKNLQILEPQYWLLPAPACSLRHFSNIRRLSFGWNFLICSLGGYDISSAWGPGAFAALPPALEELELCLPPLDWPSTGFRWDLDPHDLEAGQSLETLELISFVRAITEFKAQLSPNLRKVILWNSFTDTMPGTMRQRHNLPPAVYDSYQMSRLQEGGIKEQFTIAGIELSFETNESSPLFHDVVAI